MKRFIMLLVLIILFSNFSFASEEVVFTDISDDYWAKDAILTLINSNIISGYPDGSFRPRDNIKINEFIAMVVKSMGYEIIRLDGEDWVTPYIRKAKEIGMLNNDQFLYNSLSLTSYLTREEMIRIAMDSIAISEGLPYTDVTNQYVKYSISDSDRIHSDILSKVIDAFKLGIISGYPDGTLKPKNNVTRAEAASILVRIIDPNARKPYTDNPYKGISSDSVDVPVVEYEDSLGKNVGFDYIWNLEYASLYSLERSYDEKGNLVEVIGNNWSPYTTKINYIQMFAPLYKGKPINEVVELTRYFLDNRNNGNGFLEVYPSININGFGISAYKSKEYVESIYIEEKHPVMQSIYHVQRIDFMLGFNPYSSYENLYLSEGIMPFKLSLSKNAYNNTDENKTYGEYIITTYGTHIKKYFEVLFEDDATIMWNQFAKGLDYSGEYVVINSTLNNRSYRLAYGNSSLSLDISLKK